MKNFKLLTFPLLVLIATITVACANTPEKKNVNKLKREAETMAFPKHPGTIKRITMLDKSVKIVPIDKIPKWNQFVYYDKDNVRTNIKSKAVKAIPIVEERMYSKKGQKLVSKKEATYIWIEMYGPKGKLLKTHTLWRGGVRGGQRAKTQ